jgi:two-component system chemotaxis response regulator CheY
MTKVLIVDDSMFMRNMIKRALAENLDKNIETIDAGNGNEAVEKYIEFRPDMVLMDISMPLLGGVDAVREIKNFDPNAKIIMVTAINQEAMVTDSIEAGALDFIVKPFKPEQLAEVVAKHCRV